MLTEVSPLKIHEKGRMLDENALIKPVGLAGEDIAEVARIEIIVRDEQWSDFKVWHNRPDVPVDALPTFLRKVAITIERSICNADIEAVKL